jgi:hypothetical protein
MKITNNPIILPLVVSLVSGLFAAGGATIVRTTSPEAGCNFEWEPGAPVFQPGKPGSFDEIAVKDPSVVFFEGNYHLFYTARGRDQYRTGYVRAPSLQDLDTAPRHCLDRIRGASEEYGCAPQVFFFEPQQTWYLVFQTRDRNYQPAFSTTRDLSAPDSWSDPKPLLEKDTPEKWIDFWILCDEAKAYLFYTQGHRDVYVRSADLEDFPGGWGPGTKVFSEVHEAVHVYKKKNAAEYHMIYELNHEGIRSFGLAVAPAPAGPWQKITDQYASSEQLAWPAQIQPWTRMVSHGEAIRTHFDQRMEYDSENVTWLIQGLIPPTQPTPYEDLQWRLGAIVRTGATMVDKKP